MQLIDALEELEKLGEQYDDKIVWFGLDKTGDTRLVWDPNNTDDVEEARKAFDEAKRKGKTIYRVGENGEPTTQMREFEAKSGKFIAAPRMVGG